MVLAREDFVAFRANWHRKSDNLRSIADELNIALDALVFVDDNPAEREEVRQALPQVFVPELTANPADYPMIVDATRCFEVSEIVAEVATVGGIDDEAAAALLTVGPQNLVRLLTAGRCRRPSFHRTRSPSPASRNSSTRPISSI